MNKKAHNRSMQRLRNLTQDRARRIRRLIDMNMITSASEIPEDAIPIDPDRSPRSSSSGSFYQNTQFICSDCGNSEEWSAVSQQYYFEILKASPYKQAKRCYSCRQKEIQRRDHARIDSGHRLP